jgi:hypothetical protein
MQETKTMAERGKLGGQKTYEKYGSDHFRNLQKLSWERQQTLDAKAGKRLSRAGLKAIDPVPENGAWTPAQDAL